MFFVALSFHSIFDGLGLGADDASTGFYGLLITVLSHKILDGFAVGLPVYLANFPRLHIVFCLVFCACMTPLGIGLGMAITSSYSGASSQLARAIILSITSGTFFFIGVIELLPSSLSHRGWLKTKLFCFALGWAAMAIVAIWA